MERAAAFDVRWSPQSRVQDKEKVVRSVGEAPSVKVHLQDFQTPKLLDFGTVKVAAESAQDGPVRVFAGVIELANHESQKETLVSLDRFSAKHGFSVPDAESGWTVPVGGSVAVAVHWQPKAAGGVRQSISFSFLNASGRRVRVAAFLTGVAAESSSASRNVGGDKRKKKTQTTSRPSRPKPASTMLRASAKENAASHANTSQPLRELSNSLKNQAPPSQRNPGPENKMPKQKSRVATSKPLLQSLRTNALARSSTHATLKDLKSRRVLFDNQWMEKQEQGFSAWLNFVLDPEHGGNAAEHMATQNGEEQEVTLKPLAELARKQRNAALQRAAFAIYHSPEMENVAYMVDREIASGGLAIRKDRDLFKDLGLRRLVTDLLMRYNLPWLRLGLEIVLGISVGTNVRSIRKVVANYFVGDPELDETYRETKKGLFDENPEYKAELRRRTLRRFLMLVLFLDRAKGASIIDNPSCLFRVDSPTKSSQDMVIAFSKEFLSGEGNVVRHLQHSCDFEVFHRQSVLDEFDFRVSNLATDLRDGVRLTRAVELLTCNKDRDLSALLRAPAVSRLQKLHNVGVALKELESHGIDLASSSAASRKASETITNKDVVDGHRRKTLSLLWKMIAKWRLSLMLPAVALKDEVKRLCDSHGPTARSILARAREQASQQELHETSGSGRGGESQDIRELELVDSGAKHTKAVLLEWSQAVCAHHGMRISNLTTSMANGRALCILIHHYHPKLLPRDDIQGTCVDVARESASSSTVPLDLDWLPFDTQLFTRAQFSKALGKERANFALVNEAVAALGCVPVLLPTFDSENVPEEKLMMLFLTYLCSRLLASRDEIAAAVKIQNLWYRKTRVRRLKELGKRAESAAVLLQAWVRRWLARRTVQKAAWALQQRAVAQAEASTVIATWWRGSFIRQNYVCLRASTLIAQRAVRAMLASRRCQAMEAERCHAVVKVQCLWRRHLARETRDRRRAALVLIQSSWRGSLTRSRVSATVTASIRVQTAFRRHAAAKAFLRARAAAIKIQSLARSAHAHAGFKKQVTAATHVQAQARAFVCYQRFCKTRQATCLIQRNVRAWTVRCRYRCQIDQITVLQSIIRMHLQRAAAARLRANIVVVQSLARGHAIRSMLKKQHRAAAVIQSRLFRSVVARCAFNQSLHSIVAVQKCVRGWSVRLECSRRLVSATRIQALYRSVRIQRLFLFGKQGVVAIQALFRMRASRTWFSGARQSACAIQTAWRSHRLLCCNQAAVRVQAVIRGRRCRSFFMAKRFAAHAIQARVRGYLRRQEYKKFARAVQRVQAAWRAYMGRCLANEIRATNSLRTSSAVILQAAARSWMAKKDFAETTSAIIVIQSFWRQISSANLFDRCQKAVVVLQRFAREYCMLALTQRRALCRFQAIVRGALVRKRRSKELERLYARLKAVSNAATARTTLGSRTKSALQWILNSKDLAQVNKACITLEMSTQVSKECAAEFLSSDASDVLFKLIRTLNRSEPHVRLLTVTFKILVQVSKYDKDALFVRVFANEEGSSLALVDVMQMFRDKPAILKLALNLFEKFCSDRRRATKHLAPDSEIHRRLCSIEQVLRRKCELASRNGLRGKSKAMLEKQLHQKLSQVLSKLDRLAKQEAKSHL